MSDASLVDALVGSKRIITRPGMDQIEYHSMFVTAEELGAFQGKYPENIVGLLTAFYDPDPYGQERRGKEIKIKMHRPQLNMLIGVTPSNLMTWMPPFAWDQGFTSRIILVYGDDQQIIDDFETQKRPISRDLLYDLQLINGLVGEFTVTEDYKRAVDNWRKLGQPDLANPPKANPLQRSAEGSPIQAIDDCLRRPVEQPPNWSPRLQPRPRLAARS